MGFYTVCLPRKGCKQEKKRHKSLFIYTEGSSVNNVLIVLLKTTPHKQTSRILISLIQMADAAKRLKRRLFDSFQTAEKKNHVAVTVTHVKTPNKTSNSNASKSQDVNTDASKKKKKKKKKRIIDTHQPQPQADDVDPFASQGVNDTPLAAGDIEIILQSFADRIDREGIYIELFHRDVVANLVELWRLFKDAEIKCKLQEARFREELLNAAVISSSHTS